MSSVRAGHIPHCFVLSDLSRHLYDSSHRETYESAHSVILSIFAAQTGSTPVAEVQGTGVPQPTFLEKIVPFYARCLLEVCPDVLYSFSANH